MAQCMDRDRVNELFECGAILILLDAPVGTEIGIDMFSWQCGHNFKGIKMIPPGLHFVYYSACDDNHQTSPRTGFFHTFHEKEVQVRRWDRVSEVFGPPITDEEELMRFKDNKKDLDRFCGPYPFESYKKWISLTQHVTSELTGSLQPENGYIQAAASLVSESSNSQMRAGQAKPQPIPLEKMTADNLMDHMKQTPGSSMRYTAVSKFKAGSKAVDITSCAMDASSVLEEMLNHGKSWQDVLGELELAFICFLIGLQLESFDQWKKLVALLCGCQDIIPKQEDLYSGLINVLHFQLKEMPADFFVDIVSRDNFLTLTLHELYINITESSASAGLQRRVKSFCDHLTARFGWDFESEPADSAPVVVDEFGNY